MLWRVEASEVEVAVRQEPEVRAEVGVRVRVPVPVVVKAAGPRQALILDIYLVAHQNLALVRGHHSVHVAEVYYQMGCTSM
jgi:hypothetical protein